MSDLDVLKDIPGYKAILKSVLKSQIQLLMEQLSEHAGEEAIVLTASVNDGSLSHLGSSTGKGFFEGRDEIKSQFLGYCLKTYHKQKTREPPKPYQRKHPSPRTSPSTQPAKRPCLYPMSLSQSPADTYSSSIVAGHGMPERRISQDNTDSKLDLTVGKSGDISGDPEVKTELNDQNTSNSDTTPVTPAAEFLPSSIHLSHTQVASETSEHSNNDETDPDNSKMAPIKVEQLEDELEITGVEMAAGNFDTWGQGQPGYMPEGGDSSFSMGADQSAYTSDSNTKPKAGIVQPYLAEQANMVEVYPSTGVFWYSGQLECVLLNGNEVAEQTLSKAVDVFFSKQTLKECSARGGGSYPALDQTILHAVICFIQEKWDVKESILVKVVNDKCSNARRGRRLGMYSKENYLKRKELKKQKAESKIQ